VSGTSPSDKLGSLLGRLHPMTRFLVVAVILYIAASVVREIYPTPHRYDEAPLALKLTTWISALAYGLTLFAGPATVEFLFRIWDELKRARTGL
jgi:hypothetical protein